MITDEMMPGDRVIIVRPIRLRTEVLPAGMIGTVIKVKHTVTVRLDDDHPAMMFTDHRLTVGEGLAVGEDFDELSDPINAYSDGSYWFEVYQSADSTLAPDRRWRWCVRGASNRIVQFSEESFANPTHARWAAQSVVHHIRSQPSLQQMLGLTA